MGTMDPLVSNGDKRVENGNYVKSDTCFGRVARSLNANYYRWTGGRDYKLGNKFWARAKKDTKQNRTYFLEDSKESLQEWVDEGMCEIRSAEIGEAPRGDGTSIPVLLMEVYDTGRRINITVPVETPWSK